MTTAQMELTFGTRTPRLAPRPSRRSSLQNPRWWFERMRQMVDQALDWQPAPPPRPEQILLPSGDFRLWSA